MDNIGTEGTQDQYITSPSGEALGKDFHMINSECDKKNYTTIPELGRKKVDKCFCCKFSLH